MKILAIDTATEACSAGLLFSDKQDGIFEICPQQQSQRILPMIDELLTRNRVTLNELDAIAYGRGPGSFTGVRIASSTVQGLALGMNLPVLEVSTLAAMAQENYATHGIDKTLALIDARMGEVYFGQFALAAGQTVQAISEEAVMPPEEVIAKLGKLENKASFVGTGFQAYQTQLGLSLQKDDIQVSYPNAIHMLALAKSQFEAGNKVPVEDVSPVYLRDKVTWKKLPGRE